MQGLAALAHRLGHGLVRRGDVAVQRHADVEDRPPRRGLRRSQDPGRQRFFAEFAVRGWEEYARAAGADLAAAAGLPAAAELLTTASAFAADDRWVAACLARAHGWLTVRRRRLSKAVVQSTRIEARFERRAPRSSCPIGSTRAGPDCTPSDVLPLAECRRHSRARYDTP